MASNSSGAICLRRTSRAERFRNTRAWLARLEVEVDHGLSFSVPRLRLVWVRIGQSFRNILVCLERLICKYIYTLLPIFPPSSRGKHTYLGPDPQVHVRRWDDLSYGWPYTVLYPLYLPAERSPIAHRAS